MEIEGLSLGQGYIPDFLRTSNTVSSPNIALMQYVGTENLPCVGIPCEPLSQTGNQSVTSLLPWYYE